MYNMYKSKCLNISIGYRLVSLKSFKKPASENHTSNQNLSGERGTEIPSASAGKHQTMWPWTNESDKQIIHTNLYLIYIHINCQQKKQRNA